ncbi:MAG: hypothetical protein [Microviridae sp.]|nr:MAG: hypothetical protein [Microviridae sp.]
MKSTEGQRRLRSTINFQLKKKDMEQPKGKSLTIPDDTYTVSELLERHARGLPLAGRPGTFIEDTDIEDDDLEAFNRMDITDRFEAAERAGQIVREEHEHKENKKKKKEAEERADYQKYKNDKAKKPVDPPEKQADTEKSATK